MMFTEIGTNIEKAAQLLLNNEIVAIPTETVYGLAGNALNEISVSKIYAAKNRPHFNPLILHLSDKSQLNQYAFPDQYSILLAEAFMPGSLTLLLPKKSNVPDIATAGSDKVAVRVPNHSMTLELLHAIPFPLAAPSANPSGYISPTTATHVLEGLNGKIPYILNGGSTTVGVESTICEVKNDHIVVHRAGGISANMLKEASGLDVIASVHQPSNPQTPGQLKSHYAPNTPLFRGNVEDLIEQNKGRKTAVISFQKDYSNRENMDCYVLSKQGNISEAANQLFAIMRAIDAKKYEVILTEIFPEEGIGSAINDRLDRAQFLHK